MIDKKRTLIPWLQKFENDVMESDDSFWLIEFYAPWCGMFNNCHFLPLYDFWSLMYLMV